MEPAGIDFSRITLKRYINILNLGVDLENFKSDVGVEETDEKNFQEALK
jgi:hypothetical protein